MATWIKHTIKATELSDISYDENSKRFYFIAKQPQTFVDGKLLAPDTQPVGNEDKGVVEALHKAMTDYLKDNDFVIVEGNRKLED